MVDMNCRGTAKHHDRGSRAHDGCRLRCSISYSQANLAGNTKAWPGGSAGMVLPAGAMITLQQDKMTRHALGGGWEATIVNALLHFLHLAPLVLRCPCTHTTT